MRILFLTPQFYPHVGGVEKHVYEVSLRLVKKGHRVIIVTEEQKHTTNPHVTTLFIPDGLTIYYIPITKSEKQKKFEIWKWLYKNKLLFNQADIIHMHDVFYWYLPFRFLYPLKKVYTTFHGYESYPIPKKNILMRILFEKLSTKTICIGHFMTKWYHQHPTKILYGGVNSLSKDNATKRNAVFIGRLDEHTGFADYIEALSKIREKIPAFTLTVYGDGPLQRLAQKTKGVIYKGFDLSAEESLKHYTFAFVSRNLAILEAMANRCLVIASYDSPLKYDYLTMTPYAPYLLLVNSATQIFDAVIQFETNQENKAVQIKKGFELVRTFTWDRLTTEYETLWDLPKNSSKKG